jgi:hypothetical protein
MPNNIINASSAGSGGLITTAADSGSLEIQSNGTTIMTIGSTGVTTQVGAPSFSANAGSSQSISNGTATKLLYATEDWDTNSNYASSTFTPTVAGYYQVSVSVYIGGTNNMELAIRKNGSEYMRFSQLSGYNICGSGIVYFNGSTDYVEAWMFNGHGSTVTVNGYTFAKFQAAMIRSS